jgi:hypothetical protein
MTWAASAFDGHRVTEGPLEISIGEVQNVRELDRPYDVVVTLQNTGQEPLQVDVLLRDLVDEWYAVGQTNKHIPLDPGRKAATSFRIAAGAGAVSALYPVHVYASFERNGRKATAHAVGIFESDFERAAAESAEPRELPINVVPANGALPLWPLETHRVVWRYYGGPLVYMPVGWKGSSSQSAANFSTGQITRGATKQALVMHPPWKPGGGTIFAEYGVKLPRVTPIALAFANAIRDHTADEPASDGVTFRVWAGDEPVFERHADGKQWVEGEADLSRYAGQTILLRLESHPGADRNTTCDSSYWGEPTIVAGAVPEPISQLDRKALRNEAITLLGADTESPYVIELAGHRAAVAPGDGPVSQAVVAIGNDQACVVFDGLQIGVLGNQIGGLSAVACPEAANWSREGAALIATQPLQLGEEQFDLTVRFWPEGTGLRIKADCPKRITDYALGSADQKAPRVYYGHGYCIVEPEAFRAGFGGHNLSTSHVGFDFEKGLSVLVATDHPPDFLEVNPESKTYALHTHLDATMTLVPSAHGAFDCARKYRPLYDKQPSEGFTRKAGRFVFDIWGGRYADIAETMQQTIDYGLTDSLLTVHVWQRWGYDYRLPDIYPPLPSLGTVDDVRKIAQVCAEHDIPWGLHDNYIDIYPDCEDYSYDHVCFTEDGIPVRAWYNRGRDAQSYRWRPDRFMPFLQRNLRLIKPNLEPTHYFIDVFTSIGCFDYYDKQGRFHSMLETRKHWGEAFAWIQDYLGENAPMTSEAGHDQLIGYLDGSDCQHLQLTPESARFCIRLRCQDWERVPWFDAVLHDKFSLHGVGYSGRYQGGRSREAHGIESDDYISAEVLEGHALMIDRAGFGRGAVRKYWLAQDFIRSIATDEITNVEFVDGDIHRQIISWKSGGRVYVNRGPDEWRVADKILPQYGYFASNNGIESSIERINDILVEQSHGPGRWYFNARGFGPENQPAIRPQAVAVEHLGGRRFRLLTDWHAHEPAPKDLHVFLHFGSAQSSRSDKIAFQADSRPSQEASQWKGTIRLGEEAPVHIPAECEAGEYEILVGLWDPRTGRRYALLGDEDGQTRYRVGKLIVQGANGSVTGVRLAKQDARGPSPQRWNVAKKPIDFGPAQTSGAFRCQRQGRALLVTPLPDLAPFSLALRPNRFGFPAAKSVHAVDADGTVIRSVRREQDGDTLRFQTRRGEFAYRIRFEQ